MKYPSLCFANICFAQIYLSACNSTSQTQFILDDRAIFVCDRTLLRRTTSHNREISLACVRFRMIVLCIVSWCLCCTCHAAAACIINDTSRMVNTRTSAAHRRLITRQSLCAEMASELRFAVRCGSRQRPAAKSRNSTVVGLCGRCSPHASRRRTHLCSSEHEETTYIPSIEIPRLNGVSLVPHDWARDRSQSAS